MEQRLPRNGGEDLQICRYLNETPLHEALSDGNIDQAKKIYGHNPKLAKAIDSRRRSALHLAAASGYADMVDLLLSKGDLDMCSARDADGRNPLHLAAMNGKKEVLKTLVEKCPHAAEGRTDRGETILHLCFKYNHKEDFTFLLQIKKLQKLINAKDDDGNTLLHLAVADEATTEANLALVKSLLSFSKTERSSINVDGDTPLDLAEETHMNSRNIGNLNNVTIWKAAYNFMKNRMLVWRKTDTRAADADKETSRDLKIDIDITKGKKVKTLTEQQVDALRNEGAERATQLGKIKWLTKKRDALMVVASLIATMAFQAGVSPPGGVWQDNSNGHRAGETVMAYNYPNSFPYFLKLNTVGLVGSLSTILLLISELPFRKRTFMWILVVIMWGTITAMAFTYSFAITVITPVWARASLSSTIKVGVIVWGFIMVILLLWHTFKLILNVKKDHKVKTFISKSKRRLGFGSNMDSSSFEGSPAKSGDQSAGSANVL